jgi:hypothetical protein
MNLRAPLSAAVGAVLAVACADSTKAGSPDAGLVGTAKGLIDPSLGGSLAVGDATLTIPPGAIPASAIPDGGTTVEITMTVTSDPTPVGYTAYSRLYRFGPNGLSFTKSVTVSIPFTPPAASAQISIFWSRSGATGFDPLSAKIAGSLASVDVTHFSEGFVANGGSDTGSCPVPQKSCSGSCVSLDTDANCGECGHACVKGEACFTGLCKSLEQWAQWPVTPDAPTQYTYTSDTVLDGVTALTWQRNPPDTMYLWQDAVDYCSGLSLEGSQTWRMPSRIELLSIVDLSRAGPAINASAFPETRSNKYWAYTISPLVFTDHYFVNFASGECDTPSLDGVTAHVRCVR